VTRLGAVLLVPVIVVLLALLWVHARVTGHVLDLD
jgi:hypothetical protein